MLKNSTILLATITLLVVVLAFSILLTESNKESLDSPSAIKTEETTCEVCPKLGNRTDTIEHIDEVLEFVASECDMGNLHNIHSDTFYKIEFKQIDVESYLKIFKSNEGVAICGLTSILMAKILDENGIRAYTYNFGFKDTEMTHVVTLVSYQKQLLIYDPFINYKVMATNGNTTQNQNMFEVLRNMRDSTFKPLYVSNELSTDLLVPNEFYDSMDLSGYSADCLIWTNGFSSTNEGYFTRKATRSFESDYKHPCNSFIKRMEVALHRNTDLTKFHQSYSLKINKVYGSEGHQKIDSILEVMTDSLNILNPRFNNTN